MSKSMAILQANLGDLSEWRFTGGVTYHPVESLDDWFCVCGARILYAHQVKRIASDEVVTVGSECVKHFKSNARGKLKDLHIGAEYDYLLSTGKCLKCEGSGKWINPYKAGDIRECFACRGTGKR